MRLVDERLDVGYYDGTPALRCALISAPKIGRGALCVAPRERLDVGYYAYARSAVRLDLRAQNRTRRALRLVDGWLDVGYYACALLSAVRLDLRAQNRTRCALRLVDGWLENFAPLLSFQHQN